MGPHTFELALVYHDDLSQTWVSLGDEEIRIALASVGIPHTLIEKACATLAETLDKKARQSIPQGIPTQVK